MSEASTRPRRRRSSKWKRGSPLDNDRSARISLIRRSQKPPKEASNKFLPRCASEPILGVVQLLHDQVIPESDKPDDTLSLFINPTFYSCYDLFEPPLLHPSQEERRVLVSVTVEGTVGPVKALVRLGASVEEAIHVVLQRYKSEGRSPQLDTAVAASFQLHHSHFCLQSLDKNGKIGEVGGRSFYLRKNCETMGSFSGRGSNLVINQRTNILSSVQTQAVNTSRLFMSFIIKKINKIKRRTIRFLRLVTCDNCL